MNPRTVFIKYMGWCPGVEYASNFLPNKEYSERFAIIRMTCGIAGFILLGLMLSGVPVPARPPYIDLKIKTNQESYIEGETLNVEFVFINRMPFTIKLEPFTYYEEALYRIENNQSILLRQRTDDALPRSDEKGMILRPFNSVNQDCLVSFPELTRGNYLLLMEVDEYRVYKNIQIQ